MYKMIIIVILFMSLISITSCKKHELDSVEYLQCTEQYDKQVEQINSLYQTNHISETELSRRMNNAKKEYNQCIIDAGNNKK
jgi:hypothetical protein